MPHRERRINRTRMTQSGHEWAAFAAMHVPHLLYSHDLWVWGLDEATRAHHPSWRRGSCVAAESARAAAGDAGRRERIACAQCPCKEGGVNYVNLPV